MGGNFPRGQLSGGQFSSGAIVRGQLCGGQSSWGQLSGVQSSSGAIVLEPLQMDLIFSIRNFHKKKKIIQNILLLQPNDKLNVIKRKLDVRKYWVRPGKGRYWWENFASRKIVEEEWRENFSMSKETFRVLCTELYPYIFKNDIRF